MSRVLKYNHTFISIGTIILFCTYANKEKDSKVEYIYTIVEIYKMHMQTLKTCKNILGRARIRDTRLWERVARVTNL